MGMTTYDDALGDKGLYVNWLLKWHDADELAAILSRAIRDGGYTVTGEFVDALAELPSDVLATMVCRNTPIEDDMSWQRYCEETYPSVASACLTARERNGVGAPL